MNRQVSASGLDLWGGFECTVARIGEHYRDQCRETGHHERLADIDAVADLGIRTLRYPILWETVSPDRPDQAGWGWHDERLARLRDRGIRVIATLCHHGSGPRYTNLLEDDFAPLLAAHAARVAQRYPWIDAYTPVNEPLTTARFSALYGHWYPHSKSSRSFLTATLNQCRATALAMQAIRLERPDAGLVQTEDLGRVFSTPRLRYQASHENVRRWLSLDLLFGRIEASHPLFEDLDAVSSELERELELFAEGRSAPQIVGINHYLTSDRFLDERTWLYPDHHRGGNQFEAYADAEAVRIEALADRVGPYTRLKEAWDRYRSPVAITEVHHGCSRDEQLRWLLEVWNAADRLRNEGADVRAVTIWALLGVVDWNSLLTRRENHYEPGAFDIRGPAPRLTALGRAARALATGKTFTHPVLEREGWWHRHDRFYAPAAASRPPRRPRPAPKLLITGASGTLGRAFERVCQQRGLDCLLTSRQQLDITSSRSIAQALEGERPWAVINTAGYVRVAEAEHDAERCMRANAAGAAALAAACEKAKIPFVTFSSDLVFDGRAGRAYLESDAPSPESVYGKSKAEAERAVAANHPSPLVIRTSTFFGPWDRYNFAFHLLTRLAAGERCEVGGDVLTPTYVPDLVHAVLDLLIDGSHGVWHLAAPQPIAWPELARTLAQRAGLDPGLVVENPVPAASNRSLGSERGLLLPPLGGAIDRYLRDAEVRWTREASAIAAE